jgi:hypothetical protein
MAVAPPSLHVSGSRYAWVAGRSPHDLPTAPLPPWITELAAAGRAEAGGGAAGEAPPRTTSEQQAFAEAWARAGVEIRPGDRYYLCPFHPDHHPSLHVDGERCLWHCFGCGRGGGIGRLLALLGEPRPPAPRARRRGRVGQRAPVTIAGFEEVEVVGESGHQEELLALSGGVRPYGGVDLEAVAELVPGSDDDEGAVVEVRIEGAVVGRLRREDAERLHVVVEESTDVHGTATCRARIRGGWDRGRGDVGRFGVVLLLP